MSVCSSGDEFSGPDEKSISKGFRGVVKEGARKGEDNGVEGAFEKKKGWLFGSRRDGKTDFFGELNSLWFPAIVQYMLLSKK